MAPAPQLMTVEEYFTKTPYTLEPTELVHGVLRVADSPTPRHQSAVAALFRALDPHVRMHALGRMWLSPLDVVLSERHARTRNTSRRSRTGSGCGAARPNANHAQAHSVPSRPKRTKLARHPQRETISSAIGADSMPPIRDPRNITPFARPRSRIGNQREKLRATFGNAPASPAPKRNRITTE